MRRRAAGLSVVFIALIASWMPPAALGGEARAVGVPGVFVTELPLGQQEITGLVPSRAHSLRLSRRGELLSRTDPAGDSPLAAPNVDLPALEACDPLERNKRLLPAEKAELTIRKRTPTLIEATVQAGATRLTYAVEPERLGIRVDGPGASYMVRGRCPSRAEGCRIATPDATLFVSADLGTSHAGTPQLLIDGRRALALALSAPARMPIIWNSVPTGAWSSPVEHVSWEVNLKTGEVLWLAAVKAPAHEGAVRVGLSRRRLSRTDGTVAVIATLSSDRLVAGQPVSLIFSLPLEKVLPRCTVVAGLLPTAPDDPIEADEQGRWYYRLDRHEHQFLAVPVRPRGERWELEAPAGLRRGVYRLRLWIVPKDTVLPETLGGPKGVRVGYFPGLEGRGTANHQSHPQGDVLVTVGEAKVGSLTVLCPHVRHSFWHGETVPLLVQARRPGERARGKLILRRADDSLVLATEPLDVPLKDGFGLTELAVPTQHLPPGRYEVTPDAPGLTGHSYAFAVASPAVSGMPVIQSPLHGPFELDAFARLGVTAWTDVMTSTGGFAPPWPAASTTARQRARSDPALPLFAPAAPASYDEVAGRGWLFLQGVQSRQISFSLHHSIDEHVEETLRKHLVYAQLGQRFPSTVGLVFDYDLAGTFGGDDGVNGPFAQAGRRRAALLAEKWQAAWAEAKRKGATDADRPRLAALFQVNVIGDLYRRSVQQLHASLSQQRHTTSATADHAEIHKGQYLPLIYGPLDFRYLETWNDQIYPNSAHDMQECFWTSLLRMERKSNQPVWVTAPTAPQPGTHFRRVLDTVARGATGTGYNAEGAAGLTGGWGASPLAFNARAAQEELTGELARKYGTWLNQFEPAEEVGILYSISQGGFNYGLQSPVFFAYYTLAQLNRPARLVTEDEIAAGALKSLKALVIIKQKVKLPEATRKAIAAFAADGGKVLCDRDCDPTLPGTHLSDVGWPDSLWPNTGNSYHKLIRAFVPKLRDALQTALGDAGRQPLGCSDGAALVATKRAGPATLVIVTNNDHYPFDEIFTPEQQKTIFYRLFHTVGDTFFKDVRVPQPVTLVLRDDVAAHSPHIYDVFAGAELKPVRDRGQSTVTVDLATMQGRALLLTPDPLPAPMLRVGARDDADPLATLVAESSVPLPLRIRVTDQEVYRAATPAGSCDTFALGLAPGPVAVEVTELVTGRRWSASLTLSRSPQPTMRELPGVQIWEPSRLNALLAQKGLAIYVDARQADHLAAARRLADRLRNGAEVVFNPPVHDYVVSWSPTPEQEQSNDEIRRRGLLGWRRMVDTFGQWTGALQPAPVWNRPVLVFGSAVDNRLIAELNEVTLLQRPALPELLGPGRATVQPVASPFWNGRDAAIVLCADATGVQAAFDRLADLAGGKDVEAFTAVADGGARRERREVMGFESLKYPAPLRPLELTPAGVVPAGLTRVLPISAVTAVEDGVLATIHNPGRNLVRLDDRGRVVWRQVSAGFYQPTALVANTAGESVVGDDTFVWRHAADGPLRWKMLGEPIAPPLADGSVCVKTETGLLRVSAAGDVLARRESKERLVAASADGRTLFVHRPGERSKLRERSDTALVALRDGREAWSVPQLLASEAQVSADGTVLACLEHECLAGRDDIEVTDSSRLTAIDTATGRVLLRRSVGEPLADLYVSADGKRLAALGHRANQVAHLDQDLAWSLRLRPQLPNRHTDILYLADVAGGVVRRVRLPERGVWALAFSTDGKTCWAAGQRLYRVDTSSVGISPCAARRFLSLAPRRGGLYGGTADGTVAWLSDAGQIEREAQLGAGVASGKLVEHLRSLREAPLVDSNALRPHEVPAVIRLAGEGNHHQVRGELATPRGDGIQPLQVAIHIPARGRYRFTLALVNPKEQADKIGVFRINSGSDRGPRTAPIKGDRWSQAAELELGPGTELFTLMPEDWKEHPLMTTMKVEKVSP